MKNLFTLLYFCVLIPASSFACYGDCELFSFEKAIEHADEIFIGEITKVEKIIDYTETDLYGNEQIIYIWKFHFNVKKKWKGSQQKSMFLYQPEYSIGLPLDLKHREYLIYAFDIDRYEKYKFHFSKYIKKKKFFAYNCSRTTYDARFKDGEWIFEDEERLDTYFPKLIPISNLWTFKNLFLFLTGFLFSISLWKYENTRFSEG